MNGNELLDKMDLIDPKYIEEAGKMQKKRNVMLKYLSYVATILLVLSLAGAYFTYVQKFKDVKKTSCFDDSDENGEYITKYVTSDEEASEEIAVIMQWDDMTDACRYTSLVYGDTEYTTGLIAVWDENVGEMLDYADVSGYDIYTDTTHTLNRLCYAIAGINPEAAVCVKFNETDKYHYAYVNTNYTPDTLGDFISDLNLTETLETGLIYDERDASQTIVYEDVDKSLVFEMLLSDTTLENEPDGTYKDVGTKIFGISVSVDVLGYHHVTLTLTDTGYMWTNILSSGKYFYVGTEKIEAFIEEVTKNHRGYIYIYDSLTGNEELDEDATEETGDLETVVMTTSAASEK